MPDRDFLPPPSVRLRARGWVQVNVTSEQAAHFALVWDERLTAPVTVRPQDEAAHLRGTMNQSSAIERAFSFAGWASYGFSASGPNIGYLFLFTGRHVPSAQYLDLLEALAGVGAGIDGALLDDGQATWFWSDVENRTLVVTSVSRPH